MPAMFCAMCGHDQHGHDKNGCQYITKLFKAYHQTGDSSADNVTILGTGGVFVTVVGI